MSPWWSSSASDPCKDSGTGDPPGTTSERACSESGSSNETLGPSTSIVTVPPRDLRLSAAGLSFSDQFLMVAETVWVLALPATSRTVHVTVTGPSNLVRLLIVCVKLGLVDTPSDTPSTEHSTVRKYASTMLTATTSLSL